MIPQLILASSSVFKRDLFSRLGLSFEVSSPGVEEIFQAGLTPGDQAIDLAEQKSMVLAKRYPKAIVVGADQVLAFQGTILKKPGHAQKAVEQLQMLRGQVHELHTAVVVTCLETSFHRAENVVSKLKMYPNLTDTYLRNIVERDQTWHCVGAYKIESLGITLFDSVETQDFTAIIGLPLIALTRILRELGLFDS